MAGVPILVPALFAANGASAASGAKLYAYLKGTTTPQNFFVDDALVTPAANPTIANSLGATTRYLDPAKNYDLVAKSSDDATTLFSVTYNASIGLVSLGTGWETVLGLPAAGTIDNLSGVRFVATYAAMTALVTATGLSDNGIYFTYARATEEDGGAGLWRYDSASTTTADGGTILAIDGGGAGRFFRLFNGPASILWWGVDQTAFTAAEASGLTVEISPYSGTYTFATDVTSRFIGFGGTKRNGAGTAATGSAKAKNLAYGPFAMNLDATGTKNVAIGGSVLEANTTGEHNTAVGDESMRANTTGRQNTAVGLNTLMANTTGGNNVAIGVSALLANTTGSENTAVGRAALISATTADFNTMVGRNAGWKITTGAKNVGVGGEAMGSTGTTNPLTAYQSVAVGYRTQYTVETGYYNTSVGCEALYFNVSGANNTAIGWRSLFYYTGSDATAVGYTALNALTTGLRNTALGSGAGSLVTTGADNTALGFSAGYGLTTGADNTIVGSQALVAPASANNVVIGSSAGKSTLGSDNVIVGQAAGSTLTGSGNTIIGRDAEPSAAGVTNNIVLASGGTTRATFDGTNWILTAKVLPAVTESQDLGSASFEWNNIYLQNAATVSDFRRKNIIGEITGSQACDFLQAMNPVWFRYKDTVVPGRDGEPDTVIKHSRPHAGFIAQQFKEAMTKAGIEDFAGYAYEQDSDTHLLRLMEMVGILVAANKAMLGRIERLEAAGTEHLRADAHNFPANMSDKLSDWDTVPDEASQTEPVEPDLNVIPEQLAAFAQADETADDFRIRLKQLWQRFGIDDGEHFVGGGEPLTGEEKIAMREIDILLNSDEGQNAGLLKWLYPDGATT